MNEAGYIRSIHRVLPKEVYRWKIADRFTVGVPDCWYSGLHGSLWAEYKYLKNVPKKTTPKLSEHQKIWLRQRLDEGRAICVIVGTPAGGRILEHTSWSGQVEMNPLLTPREIAAYIVQKTLGTAYGD